MLEVHVFFVIVPRALRAELEKYYVVVVAFPSVARPIELFVQFAHFYFYYKVLPGVYDLLRPLLSVCLYVNVLLLEIHAKRFQAVENTNYLVPV